MVSVNVFRVEQVKFHVVSLCLIDRSLRFPTHAKKGHQSGQVRFVRLVRFITDRPCAPRFSFHLPRRVLQKAMGEGFSLVRGHRAITYAQCVTRSVNKGSGYRIIFTSFQRRVTGAGPLLEVRPHHKFICGGRFQIVGRYLHGPRATLRASQRLVNVPITCVRGSSVLRRLIRYVFPRELAIRAKGAHDVVWGLVHFVFNRGARVL